MKNTIYKKTQDKKEIKGWVTNKGGLPAINIGFREGIVNNDFLKIDFKDDENAENISWEDFFEIFEENDLIFMYKDDSRVDGIKAYKILGNNSNQSLNDSTLN